MPRKLTIIPLFMLLFVSCSKPERKEIVRLDIAEENSFVDVREVWYANYPTSAQNIDDAFRQIVIDELPPLDSVERVLGYALKGTDVSLFGVINPFAQPVAIHDSLIFIGLNHYLGARSKAYNGFPEYQRKLKTIQRLPVDVLESYFYSKYPFTQTDDQTLLCHLLYVGAILDNILKLLPTDTSETIVLGMSEDDYKWCRANEQRIWQKLIEEKLLYSSNRDIIAKLFAPSPKATMINANAPGRTLLFIGLKIAQAYERNTKIVPMPVIEFYDNNQTLIRSKYSPQNATR